MPLLIGCVAAMVALSAGIFAKVDSLLCVGRALLAFLLGYVATQIWQVIFAAQPIATEAESPKSEESESTEEQAAA